MAKSASTDLIKEVSARATQLLTSEQVDNALDSMAEKINHELHDTNPIVLCVLIGGVIPTGHLLTRLNFPLQVDYVHATRYFDDTVGTELEWIVRPRLSLKGRTVLVVDDILDGGITLERIVEYCKTQGATDVKTAVLVEKEVERHPDALQKADFTGAMVENRFVYGYGMDYKRYLRNAPGIFAVAKEDETK